MAEDRLRLDATQLASKKEETVDSGLEVLRVAATKAQEAATRYQNQTTSLFQKPYYLYNGERNVCWVLGERGSLSLRSPMKGYMTLSTGLTGVKRTGPEIFGESSTLAKEVEMDDNIEVPQSSSAHTSSGVHVQSGAGTCDSGLGDSLSDGEGSPRRIVALENAVTDPISISKATTTAQLQSLKPRPASQGPQKLRPHNSSRQLSPFNDKYTPSASAPHPGSAPVVEHRRNKQMPLGPGLEPKGQKSSKQSKVQPDQFGSFSHSEDRNFTQIFKKLIYPLIQASANHYKDCVSASDLFSVGKQVSLRHEAALSQEA